MSRVRFIDPAAWADLSPGRRPRAERENILGLGGKGGFYLNRPLYRKFVNNGQRNFVKNRKNVEWNSIYNGCHSNAKLLKIVRKSVVGKYFKIVRNISNFCRDYGKRKAINIFKHPICDANIWHHKTNVKIQPFSREIGEKLPI